MRCSRSVSVPETDSSSRSASSRSEIRPERRWLSSSASSSMPPKSRPPNSARADLRPEARPGPGQQRVEARAAGLQGQVDDPQRIGREETVEREAVGPDRGVVTLFAGVEPPLHGKFAAVGRECRSRRERPPVRPGGAAEPDQGRNRHAPPQGRVGEQRLEERKVPEVALEAGRRLHPVGVEQVFRRGVGLEVEVSGRRDFQLRLSDVAQSSPPRRTTAGRSGRPARAGPPPGRGISGPSCSGWPKGRRRAAKPAPVSGFRPRR